MREESEGYDTHGGKDLGFGRTGTCSTDDDGNTADEDDIDKNMVVPTTTTMMSMPRSAPMPRPIAWPMPASLC